MKNAVVLLQQYLDAIQTSHLAAALFAEDGVLELPYLESLGIPHSVQGPAAIEVFIGSLLGKVPNLEFRNERFLIDTPGQAFAEYSVEALVPATGRMYRQCTQAA